VTPCSDIQPILEDNDGSGTETKGDLVGFAVDFDGRWSDLEERIVPVDVVEVGAVVAQDYVTGQCQFDLRRRL